MQHKVLKPNAQKTFGETTYFGCATGHVCKLNWQTGEFQAQIIHKETHPIQAIAFDDKFIYSGGWDNRIFRYDRETLEVDINCFFYESDDEPYAHTDYVKSLCITQNQKYLFSGSADGCIHRWELPPPNTEVNLKPLTQKLFHRFINTIQNLNDSQIICAGSNHTLYVLDHQLKIIKEKEIKNCSNIKKIIIKGQFIYLLSKDIFVLDSNFEIRYIFTFNKGDPIDLYFPPISPGRFYVACEDNIRLINFDQSVQLDYYEKLAEDGAALTADQVKALLKRETPEKYEIVPSGLTTAPTGIECAKQHIKIEGFDKACYMLIYGAHDEVARRIFFEQGDRDLFVAATKKGKKEESSEIDMDEDIEMDAKKLEEIKYKRLGAMLKGSETWHKDKFD